VINKREGLVNIQCTVLRAECGRAWLVAIEWVLWPLAARHAAAAAGFWPAAAAAAAIAASTIAASEPACAPRKPATSPGGGHATERGYAPSGGTSA